MLSELIPATKFNEERYIKDEDFRFFQELVFNLAGITLSEKKRDLLLTRLGSYLRNKEFKDYTDYRHYLEKLPEDHVEWQALINLFTTNKTDFFREIAHFKYIENKLIPYWISSNKKEVKIWSAACSTGEEPYSLAMFLEQKLPSNIKYTIYASDIDTNVLSKAKNAVYNMTKEEEIPESFRKDSIQYGKETIKEWFRIKPHLKNKIKFFSHNLVDDALPDDEKFDLILCRNVMIYFSRQVIEQVAIKLYKSCMDGGELFIGHSESLQNTETSWVLSVPSVYAKKISRKK